MKLIHCADLHLGFRRFERTDSTGRNVRERDVIKTFGTLIDQIIELAPDVVVIPGDVFHTKSPANGVVVEAFAGFARLMAALPALTVIMVAGNHDAPLDAATTCILRLFTQLGIHVVERDATRLDFPALELSVLAVPDRPGMVAPAFEPNPAFKYNVLVLHGEVGDAVHNYARESGLASGGLAVTLADIQPAQWTYVALGHYHVYSQLAPNVFYSGSVDYTSTDPWREIRDESALGIASKGFVEHGLETGAHHFHILPRSRDHIDLRLDADGMGESDLAAALECLLDDAWPDDAICRVIVDNCTIKLSALQNVDGYAKKVREFKSRALNLQIDLRKPVIITAGDPRPIRTYQRPPSLEQLLTDHLRNREWPSDISLEAITKLSQGYLAQADAIIGEKSGRNVEDLMPDLPAIAS